jgi:hypothetical protein
MIGHYLLNINEIDTMSILKKKMELNTSPHLVHEQVSMFHCGKKPAPTATSDGIIKGTWLPVAT